MLNKKIMEYKLKHNPWIQKAYRILIGSFFRLIGLFVKTDESLVLLTSYGGRAYNDSPRVLFEAMAGHPLFKKYRFVWAFQKPERFGIVNTEKVKMDSLNYFLTALRARIWITNVNVERGLRFKKKQTIYLNTWHGTLPKTGGNAVNGRNDYDFSYVDILCCDGEYSKNLYIKEHNALEKNIIYSGRPREDILYRVSAEAIENYRRMLELPKDRKIILYAPTWRESRDSGKSYSIEIPVDIEKWRKELSDEYIILFRAHFLTERINGIEFDDFIRNVSDYPDVNHLYVVSDILISDYSSVFSDYAILEKPMVCFAYDYDEYVRTRGVNREYYEGFPGGILLSEDKVVDRIKHMDYAEECRKTAEFRTKLLSRGDNATEMCIAALAAKVMRN
jgi:CDP-glycerol glycerophosphotransferase